jgi:hypothetical protein
MSRYTARLREREKRLAPPVRPEYSVVLWMQDDDPPEWATEAFRPYIPTDRGVDTLSRDWRARRGDRQAIVPRDAGRLRADGAGIHDPLGQSQRRRLGLSARWGVLAMDTVAAPS